MLKSIVIASTIADSAFVTWLQQTLAQHNFPPLTALFEAPGHQSLEHTLINANAIMVLISPDGAQSDFIMQTCALARQYSKLLLPLLVRITAPLPWYVQGMEIEDFTVNVGQALETLLKRLPAPAESSSTLGAARDFYLQRATLRSTHTIDSYRRAIELFCEFLSDRTGSHLLPLQKYPCLIPDEIPLSALTADDAPIFLHFAQWLLTPGTNKKGDHRPYKPATVQLRVAGVQNWFQFLDDYGWLPPGFPLAKAKRIASDELRTRPQRSGPTQPPDHIEEIILYYDTQQPPAALRKPNVDPDRLARWELTRLRNRALLHTLAETGGRVSEVLSLNLTDFPARYLHQAEVLRVEVVGKGGHTYLLRFLDSLPVIRDYITARGANLRASTEGQVALFVSHDPGYEGSRMSRVVAWRVVQRAARALGLHHITPHDLRHWRATQLINAGQPLDVVQDYLGHRSVETTRLYYARTDPLRVDEAARHTRLPGTEP